MQNKYNHRWRDIIDTVQNANKSEVQKIKWQQNKRKKAYHNQLDGQVLQHQKFIRKRNQEKKRERTEIQNQVQEQKRKIYASRIKKIKTQQKYNMDNYQINNDQSFIKKKQQNSFKQHPFEKLVEKDDERNQKTKQNFQLQNKLNKIQQNILRQQQVLRKQKQARTRMQFQNHVESFYKKNQENKKNHRLKFLSLKKSEKHLFNQNPEMSLQQNYVSFLNYQSKLLQKRRTTEKECLDDVLQKINKKTQISDSSPAYIGRQSCSLDRKKQLSYIDKQLDYNKKLEKEDKHPQIKSSFQKNTHHQEQKLPTVRKNIQQIKKPKPQVIKKKQQQRLYKSQAPIQKIESVPKNVKSETKSIIQKQKKIFKNYNFITGVYRTIEL